MAAYAKKGCLGKFLTLLIVLVVLVVGAVLVVGNLTPSQLGIAESIVINGKNLNELGLGDTKLFDLLTTLSGLQSPNEKVVENEYTPEDASSADDVFGGVLGETNGKPDYLELLKPAKFGKQMLLTMKDRELAYVFSEMATAATNAAEASDLQFLQKLKAEVKEISIQEAADGFVLRTVLSVNVKELVANDVSIPFFTMPEKLYFVSINKISANDKGLISSVSESISVNGQSAAMSEILWNVVMEASGQNLTKDEVNDIIGKAFREIVSNIGSVGTADTQSESDNTITGNIVYGNVGIKKGQLTLITNI